MRRDLNPRLPDYTSRAHLNTTAAQEARVRRRRRECIIRLIVTPNTMTRSDDMSVLSVKLATDLMSVKPATDLMSVKLA